LRDAGDAAKLALQRSGTADAIVSGLAPGRLAPTPMVGKSTCGKRRLREEIGMQSRRKEKSR